MHLSENKMATDFQTKQRLLKFVIPKENGQPLLQTLWNVVTDNGQLLLQTLWNMEKARNIVNILKAFTIVRKHVNLSQNT